MILGGLLITKHLRISNRLAVVLTTLIRFQVEVDPGFAMARTHECRLMCGTNELTLLLATARLPCLRVGLLRCA